MHVEVDILDGCIVCRPVGTIDAYTAPRLREAMAVLAPAPNLVVDLSAVSFIDSAGLTVLVAGIRRVRERGGAVAVASARNHVRRVLETVGFERVAPMRTTVDAARRIVTSGNGGLVAAPRGLRLFAYRSRADMGPQRNRHTNSE